MENYQNISTSPLKRKVLRGSVWTIIGYGFSQVLRLFSHLILAWLLAPEIFGLMALVNVFMYGLEMFSDIGIGPSIIQNERGDDQVFLNTAWSIQVLRGIIIWIITCIISWPFSWWYAQNNPDTWQLIYLLPVSALNIVIGGFNHTSLFSLQKELRMDVIAKIELVIQVISLGVMVLWALFWPSVWAIIAGGLVRAFSKLLISHVFVSTYKVHFQWNKKCINEIVKFGKWILLSTAFTFLASNFDKLLLGKIISLSDLGIYNIAFVFANVALEVSLRLGGSVLFPLYSKLQNDSDRLMTVAIHSREIILWGASGICVAIAVGAQFFFQTFWDPRYHYAGELARWLVIIIWVRILLYTIDRIPLSLGNSKSLFISNIIQTGSILTSVAGYLLYQLPGFILGLSVGPVIAQIYLLSLIPVKRKEIIVQSLRFSIGVFSLCSILIMFTQWINSNFALTTWMIVVITISFIPLIVSASVIYRKVIQKK